MAWICSRKLYNIINNAPLLMNDQYVTHMYIQRHPASPLEPFNPAWTAAIRNPEKSGPTEVNIWMAELRRASS